MIVVAYRSCIKTQMILVRIWLYTYVEFGTLLDMKRKKKLRRLL